LRSAMSALAAVQGADAPGDRCLGDRRSDKKH